MFYFDNFFGKKILKSSLLSEYDCFFTTREFVLTPSNRNDLEKIALLNTEFLKNKLSVSSIKTAKQIHSANINVVSDDIDYYPETDALISDIPNSVLLLNFADCVPVILYSKKDNVASVIHAGWRGTEQNIVGKTSILMQNQFNVLPENITALIGPAIGKCCFETDFDVFEKLIKDKSNKSLYNETNGKFYIDLKLLNKQQLLNTGITNIDICDYCTCCMSDIFFSYRKENGITARHSAVVKIKGDLNVSY